MQHVLANQNMAIYLTPARLAFVSDFALERIIPAELRRYKIMGLFGLITHHLFRHCFGVRMPPNAFDTEIQNPRTDMSVIPTLANPSIAQRSWLSSSDDQDPWTNAASDANSTALGTYLYVWYPDIVYVDGIDHYSRRVSAAPGPRPRPRRFRASELLYVEGSVDGGSWRDSETYLPLQLFVFCRVPLPRLPKGVARTPYMIKIRFHAPLGHGTG